MQKGIFVLLIVIISLQGVSADYALNFSTYLGGSGKDVPQDIITDPQGNIYVTGFTSSSDFPTTPGAYDLTYNGGNFDGFVSKYDPHGQLLWSTVIGGPNTDFTFSIDIDSQGYVYVTGNAGRNFPTTAGSFQPGFNGMNVGGPYGESNAFIVKLEPDGSSLVWSSYWGTAWSIRDVAVGPSDDVYVIHGIMPSHSQAPFPSGWSVGKYQASPIGGEDMYVSRIAADGSSVIWGTYIGGSGHDQADASLTVDSAGRVNVATLTQSTDIPTPNGYDTSYNGNDDIWIGQLSADGSSLLWGTYLGGSAADYALGKHAITVDATDNVLVGGGTLSSDFPMQGTPYQSTLAGQASGAWEQRGDWVVAKLASDGSLLASTYVGGQANDGGEGINVDSAGNVVLEGGTFSNDFPTTSDAYQSTLAGSNDAAVYMLSPDLSQLLYSSYMGTAAGDSFRALGVDADGNILAAGPTTSSSWPLLNAHQTNRAGSDEGVVVKFSLTCHWSDTDCNNDIGISELVTVILDWQAGSRSISELIEVVLLWQS